MQTFSTPPFLQKGDKIAIVAPARKISQTELNEAVTVFKEWGLEVVFGKNLFSSENQFSGSDFERAEDFQNMLDDVQIKAIFCARGGYGSVRLIDAIDFTKFAKNKKWIIGFSDISVFHSHIHNNFHCETLHAPMPISMHANGITKSALKKLKDTLFGKPLHYDIKPFKLNRTGHSEGVLTGGNLSVLYSIMGSRSEPNTKNKILFIEDLDEYLYHIDRMMMCLKRAGKLSNLAGLIVGGMNKMNDNPIPFGKTAYDIIHESVSKYNFPVCFNFPAGHIKNNNPLIFGRQIRLNVTKNEAEVFF